MLKMQSKANINFFGMRNDHNSQAKGFWRILILLWHPSLQANSAKKTFLVGTLREI